MAAHAREPRRARFALRTLPAIAFASCKDRPLARSSPSACASYFDWGNPDAPPLVLVHGGRDHCRNWDWVAEDLRRDYHVIAPDLRGHGDSAWSPSGDYSMAPTSTTWRS